jgi:hypothetical protein
MQLSARILANVGGANAFSYADAVHITEGDGADVYLQLIDVSVDTSDEGYHPPGRRFVPAEGATLEVTVGHIDTLRRVMRVAVQPFPGDASIWRFTLLPTDPVRGSQDLKLRLVEGTRAKNGVVRRALSIAPLNAGF